MKIIELRSDTFTLPTPEMRDFMFQAPLGDDVFGEDPSVKQLELFAAEMFGMEAALFCPSGTMTNQIAINVHTHPGDEVICDAESHIYYYEGGGIARNSGCQPRLIQGKQGKISPEQINPLINPDDVHRARTRLVSLENTSNRGGGSCYELADIQKIQRLCKENGLKLHLDGARLMNAIVAKKQDPKDYGQLFDSISLCLSKGLGAPVGSLLMGSHEFIKEARRVRKVMGGGMRQAGILAAGGLFALKNHVDRLTDDHKRAKLLEATLEEQAWVEDILPVETNIVVFKLIESIPTQTFVDYLKEHSINAAVFGAQQIRMVTHLNINDEDIQRCITAIDGFQC